MAILKIVAGLLTEIWLLLFFTVLLPVVGVLLGLGVILLTICNYLKSKFNLMLGK